MKTTILDLKKGQKVWGGLKPQGHGFAEGSYMAYELTVTKCVLDIRFGNKHCNFFEYPLRLTYGSDMVIYNTSLCESAVYPTKENFIDGVNAIRFAYFYEICERLNLEMDEMNNPQIWTWDADKKESVLFNKGSFTLDLLDLRLPEGYYASKEECDKANKKLETLVINKTYKIEVVKEDVESIIDNPTGFPLWESDLVDIEVHHE